MIDGVRIYVLQGNEKEIHLLGEHVALCWTLKSEMRTIKGDDGKTYRAEVYTREEDPYIDFVWVRGGVEDGDAEGYYWEDDDNVGSGGMDAKTAVQVSTELQKAAKYLTEGNWLPTPE